MDVVGVMAAPPDPLQPQQQQQQAPMKAAAGAERLNLAVVQQLNLESVKTRAIGLFKAISRILDEFNAIARTNATPKWQDVLGQFSMVNLELFNIVEDIKKVSKAFVVCPKNVNAESATILPVMLSSKLLPEMEAEDNAKREQLLHGMQKLPVPMQIEKLKNRIDMIGAACETAEKIISDARKAYGLGGRQGLTLIPTLDKAQAAKIQEQENLLRAAVNFGEGLRVTGDQRHISSLPMHLMEVLPHADGMQNVGDLTGSHLKNMPPSFSHGSTSNSGSVMQGPGSQLMGRSAPSPSGISGTTTLEHASTPPLHYANSPRSSANLMNTPSPQQQQAQQQQHQRQKMMQLTAQQQQLLAQQQLRQSSNAGPLSQSTMQQLHDLQGQTQQKFQTVPGQHQMQYSQSLTQQQFQNRQLQTAMQHNISQNQINQGNQLRSNLGQFTGSTSTGLFTAAQTTQNSQLISNMSGIPSQTTLPRMQFGLSGAQRNYPSQILNDQTFNMGTSNPAMQQQQQQLSGQGAFGNMSTNAQNLQAGIIGHQTTTQNPNFSQQRQLNPQ